MTVAKDVDSIDDDCNVIEDMEPPTIDLSNTDEDVIVKQIYDACYTWGFFQVIHHGISMDLVDKFKQESTKFFKTLSMETKLQLKRNSSNSRGYFDDELTKQKRDWKEAIDIGIPGSRNWSLDDKDIQNACLDGYNQFPSPDILPEYRTTFIEYYTQCELLSDRIAILMAKGLGVVIDEEGEGSPSSSSLVSKLRTEHTSYLRTNYYPPHHGPPTNSTTTSSNPNEPPPVLGISPHKDAGFLTVLLQDDDCHSLQVAKFFNNNDESLGGDPKWITVHPTPNAFTINTGDMAMIWSNGRYKAPLHRVLTNESKERISAPFFYNPGFTTIVEPLPSLLLLQGEPCNYYPCCWGYFRAVRFSGDFTDIGIEIQISDFLMKKKKTKQSSSDEEGGEGDDDDGNNDENANNEVVSPHLKRQQAFLDTIDFQSPFDIEKYRSLLES